MTLRHYVPLLTLAPSGTCRVVFPDLPGCTSAGRDLQHAAEQAAEGCSRSAYIAQAVRDRLHREVRFVAAAQPLGAADVLHSDLG